MKSLLQVLKGLDIVNSSIRYNPMFKGGASEQIRCYTHSSLEERQKIRGNLLARTQKWALQTKYGLSFNHSPADWPILNKDLVRKDPYDFLRSRYLKIGAGTGGTTGTPLKLFRSFENIAVERLFIDGLLTKYDLDLRHSKIVILRADEVKSPSDHAAPFGVYKNAGRTLVLSNAHLHKKNLPWFVEELRQFRPSVLYVYPSMLENLLALLEESNEQIDVPIVLSSSEMINGSLFEKVAKQLGGRLIDYYGQGERVAFASAESRDTYFFDPVYGNVELFPDSGSPGIPGVRSYRVIASGFWNSAMPLVRYDTGDFAMVREEDTDRLHQIESGDLPFLGIKGRNSEFVIGPDGEVVSGLNHLPRGVSHLLRMQVVQDSSTSVCLRVLVEEKFSTIDERMLLDNAKALLPSTIGIAVQKCNTLERGKNGKIPFVIRSSDCCDLG